ncbi:MAG: hypothetical protein ACTSUE_12015 [Promethearchaeota archaeon]
MKNFDYVTPFVQSTTTSSVKASFSFEFDLTSVIIKLYFDTGGKIEKKYGDLVNIAVAYWPFYIVPINASNAYIIEGKNLYGDKLDTKIQVSSLPALAQDVDEADAERFVKSLEKHVSKMEGYNGFPKEHKKIEGLIPKVMFQEYFVHLFKKLQKPYLDSYYPVPVDITENAVNFSHEEITKLFDDAAIDWASKDLEAMEGLCKKWIEKIQDLIDTQETDPIASLKKKGKYNFPVLIDGIDGLIANLKESVSNLRAQSKQEQLKESINRADTTINDSNEVTKILSDYRGNLKQLDDLIQHEVQEIEAQRKVWLQSIEKIRALQERERIAVTEFQESERSRRSRFLSERTISFKTDKVVLCGVPLFLLNFQNKKNGKVSTMVLAPVLLEEASMLHKSPYRYPKGHDDFEKSANKWLLKPQNEYEVQSNIKSQDMLSLPNLTIEVSNGIDDFLDMGYLKKKTHKKIRDDELHQLLKKG